MTEDPTLEEARRLFYRANAYSQKNQNRQAVPLYREALEIYPELFCARLGLAISLARVSHFEQALTACREGILNWEDNPPHIHLLFLTMGDIYLLQGDYAKAESAYFHALKHTHHEQCLYTRIGAIRCKTSLFGEAFDLFLKAAKSTD